MMIYYGVKLERNLEQALNCSPYLVEFLLNFVISRASRNKEVQDIISGMLSKEIPKDELSSPLFYFKILFS